MIFNGPIRARSSQPGSTSPVRRPLSITASSPSAYVAARTRSSPARPPSGSTHCVGSAAELEVGDAHDAERSRLLLGAQDRLRAGAVVAEHRHQPRVRREPLALGHHPLAHRQGQRHQGDRVEPRVVAVAGDQHDAAGRSPGCRASTRSGPRASRSAGDPSRRSPGPAAPRAAPGPSPPPGRPTGHWPGRAGRRQAPLGEVDVLVPQPRQQPAALGVHLRIPWAGRSSPTSATLPYTIRRSTGASGAPSRRGRRGAPGAGGSSLMASR